MRRAEELIESGDLAAAQGVLDEVKESSGRKYFVQSKLFEKKGWRDEQRVQLLYAVNAEPDNLEYKAALELLEERRQRPVTDEDNFERVEEYLRLYEPESAQAYLNCVKEKSAKKHYLQSKIYKQKKWYNEQRKQLKAAIRLDPENEEYKRELDELEEFRRSGEYKKCRNLERKSQMGSGFGECCAECCCAGACECCAQGACESLGNC